MLLNAARAVWPSQIKIRYQDDPDANSCVSVISSPRLAAHNKLLTEMRQSGDFDRINRKRACAEGFFRYQRIAEYHAWREEQKAFLKSPDEPLPAWLLDRIRSKRPRPNG